MSKKQNAKAVWSQHDAVSFKGIHTNVKDQCPDEAFRNDINIRGRDFACFRHGQVASTVLAGIKKSLHNVSLTNPPRRTFMLNLQGPGFDDAYGGVVYNKVNPIAKIYKKWAVSRWNQPAEWETLEADVWKDETTAEALGRLRYDSDYFDPKQRGAWYGAGGTY